MSNDDGQDSSGSALDRYLQKQKNQTDKGESVLDTAAGQNSGPNSQQSTQVNQGTQPPKLDLNVYESVAQLEPANFWPRLAATIMDGMITSVVTTPVTWHCPSF